MADPVIEGDALVELRNELLTASDQLLDDRNAAFAAGDNAKVKAAEDEFDRIAVILATIQGVLSRNEALLLNAVADRLQQSISAQKAIGLSSAVSGLQALVGRMRAGNFGTPAGGTGGANLSGGASSGAASGGIRARPGPLASIVDKLIAGAKTNNLDPMTVLTIVAIESDFRPTINSPVSSAGGFFQFIDSTWLAEGGQKFGAGGVGHGFAASAPIDVQIDMGCKFIVKTAAQLKNALGGQEPTVTQIYMSHQQGMAGALAILRANPSAAIETVIKPEAAANNGFAGKTVAETIAKFAAMVRSNADEARALVMADGGGNGGSVTGGTSSASVLPSSIGPRAAHVALAELERFARQDGAVVTETHPPLRSRVLEYFTLVGRPDIVDPSAEPWSAAFISFVMRNAGAGPTQFPISQNHAKYILAGLANRVKNRLDAPIVYFDRAEIAPKVGDLIGFSRTADVKDRADLEGFLPDKFFPSHTDLVIDVSPGKIKVIGGNVSQTIKTETVDADAEGKIDSSDKHFFVLRLNI